MSVGQSVALPGPQMKLLVILSREIIFAVLVVIGVAVGSVARTADVMCLLVREQWFEGFVSFFSKVPSMAQPA